MKNKIADSHAKIREISKDKEIEEAEEVASKRKSKEIEVLKSATKQKLQEPERCQKKEYMADAERMKTRRDLESTLETKNYITTQSVNEEKPKIKEDILEVDEAKCTRESMKTMQEKEHSMKSGVKEEAQSLEAISSPPTVPTKGVKEARPSKIEIQELHQKDLSPEAKMNSKKLLELEKPITEGEIPKRKEYVVESIHREEYSYGKEEIGKP
ncbi:hypothetical protein RJT34_16382 [Clitoria ternatea]|uniref:Uncharacterized protein n=1 Tax=Clitoria ternatea TaxID=43366 RepID=A0AAN9JA42_CLITE